jgi:hypothetical protein
MKVIQSRGRLLTTLSYGGAAVLLGFACGRP